MAEKRYLFTPGADAGASRGARRARRAGRPPPRPRLPRALRRAASSGCGQVCRTANDVLLFTCSGTGAMESAVANLCSPGDRVVVVSAGAFGERWQKLAAALRLPTSRPSSTSGARRRAPDDLAAKLDELGGAKAVFLTHSETSTGVVADLQALAAAAKPSGALVVVDAVSSLGAVPLETDAWGIDVVASGSQKALMTPPGLGLVTVSPAALGGARHAPALLLRLGADARRPGEARQRVHAGRLARPRARTSRSACCSTRGSRRRSTATSASVAPAARARRRWVSSSSRPTRTARPSSPRSSRPRAIDAGELRLALRDRYGDHGRRRPRRPEGPALPDRPHRLLRRLRHHDRARRRRARPRRAGRRDRARRRASRAALEAYSAPVRDACERPRVLVREPIAEAGVELLREHFDVDVDGDSDLAETIGRLRRDRDPLGDEADRRPDRPGRPAEGDRPRRASGVDNVDVDAATRRGIVVANAPDSTVVSAAEQTIGLLVALARNIPQAHAALKQGSWERSRWSGDRARRQDARRPRLRPDRPAGGPAGARARHARRRATTRSSATTASARPASSARRRSRTCSPPRDFVTLHLPLTDETRGLIDAEAIATMKRRRAARQRRPRRARRRGGARRRDPLGQARRRRARRLLRGAVHRAAARARRGRRHAAPRRLHRRGAGPGGRDRRRADRRRARGRPGHERGQHPGRRRRRPRDARPVHPARGEARPARGRARGRVAEAGRRRRATARSPSTTRACSPSRR